MVCGSHFCLSPRARVHTGARAGGRRRRQETVRRRIVIIAVVASAALCRRVLIVVQHEIVKVGVFGRERDVRLAGLRWFAAARTGRVWLLRLVLLLLAVTKV